MDDGLRKLVIFGIKDGWLHTGDVAEMDGEGWFYLVDRKKDLINVSGYKV